MGCMNQLASSKSMFQITNSSRSAEGMRIYVHVFSKACM